MTSPTNPAPTGDVQSPDPITVNRFHANSDADVASTSQHHTIGTGKTQAASGRHKHDGIDSPLIAKDLVASFPLTASPTYSQSDFQKVIDLLNALGASS